MKKIILIIIGFSVSVYADFSRNGEIVIDFETGLVWQDNEDVKNIKKTWQGAINYCEALNLGGETNWRLPNINELISLVDDTKYNPSIDSIFKNIGGYYDGFYWSSTTYNSINHYAWQLHYLGGGTISFAKYNKEYVRCVRNE